jgi:divalent metal cation (Fe/Co/Zn/Cd) transporter
MLVDRQRYWYGFTKATQAAILAVVVVLVLLAFFLL